MENTQRRTWIITGASAGLGRALAQEVIARGDALLAVARRAERLADLVEQNPGSVRTVAADVRDTERAPELIEAAVAAFGRVDVLVNNAGRAHVGAAEEIGETDLREMLDLHLHGPAALVRAVLPTMRAQGGGTVVQLSSQGGRLAFPGTSAYSAGKFALEGWSEALAAEVAAFGVRVMIVEPSRFRTDFNAAGVLTFAPTHAGYEAVVGPVRSDLAGADGVQEGDPGAAARIVFDIVAGSDVPLRLPLGAEAVQRIGAAYRRDLAGIDRWRDVAVSADFAGAVAASRPI
ncbi:MAG TPA: SDR family NAD(P)-dependent oxidoreductase [Pseudonocardia sp.]|jgi:NADP-dependent 3-hydroxy acid dehydrogenase YdfG|nr:SDR family NAD(P)-dependent oxidoreductase [Pseudonocardia sp.]